MKKKRTIILLTLFAMFILTFAVPRTAEAASKKATKIKISYRNFYDRSYMEKFVVKGLNKNKKVVWKYTIKTPCLDYAGVISRETSNGISADSGQKYCKKNRVYIIQGNKLVTLNKRTGKKIRTVSINPITTVYMFTSVFDKNGNWYICGTKSDGEVAAIMKINSNGKMVWKTTGSTVSQIDPSPTMTYKNGKLILKNYSNSKKFTFSAKTGLQLSN